MSPRNVALRPVARADVDGAVECYAKQGGPALGVRFVDALAVALAHIARYRASGSRLRGMPPDVSELRFWPLKTFPYLVFYLRHADGVDVWRVLHVERDIPAWLQEEA